MLTGMVVNCAVSNNHAYGIGDYAGRCGGGGIYMEAGLVSNCVIAGNTDHRQGTGGEKGAGGVFFGISAPNYGGTITDSIVSNNNTIGRAGGIVVIYGPERHLLRCVVCDNQSIQVGGVLWMSSTNGMLSHCSILRNTGGYAGGAYCPTYGGTIRNCLVEGNMSASGARGISVSANNNTLRMQSLTIAGNSATNTGTGTSGGVNTSNSTNILVENCIIHSNMAVYADNRDLRFGSGLSASNYFFNTCSSRNLAPDQGNITNAPLFAAAAAGDYRLEADSPGVNAGINQEWMAGNVDLQGYSRIDQMNRLTDMGCYEYLPRGFLMRLR